jgi:hypothetical protein
MSALLKYQLKFTVSLALVIVEDTISLSPSQRTVFAAAIVAVGTVCSTPSPEIEISKSHCAGCVTPAPVAIPSSQKIIRFIWC